MASLTVTTNLQRIALKLTLAIDAISAGVGAAVPEIAAHIAQNLMDSSPVGYDAQDASTPPGDEPGKLYDSYRVNVASGPARATATIRTTQPLKLKWVRYGTGVYGPTGSRIYPRTARFLRFEVPGGQIVFARSIAGMKPNDFVTPVLEEGAAFGTERFREVIGEAMTILAGE